MTPEEKKTLTKKDLVNMISEELGYTHRDIAKTIECALDILTRTLSNGQRWEIRNFGVFEVKKRAPRKGRNPRTGVEVPVPHRFVVTFKPGKELKSAMANLSKKLQSNHQHTQS